MKTLYRYLGALVLCTALLLGASLSGRAAEARPSLTDLDRCAHREAVLLMADLGVISGKSDGTFAPDEHIDRASMAKMIYGIMMGRADPDNFLGVKTDLTDIKGHWAEGHINYCYSVGIISGNKGRFTPAGRVTVDSAAKMLLVALGYDAKQRGYEGEGWSDNIHRDAVELSLLAGIDQEGTEEITRDNAAQMIYNALFAQVRTPVYALFEGEMRIVDYRTEPETLGLRSFGLVRCVYSVGTVDPESARVPLDFVEMTPRGNLIQDEPGLMEDIALGRAGFVLGPEWSNTKIVVYLKADYTIKDISLHEIALQSVYSSEPSRLAE